MVRCDRQQYQKTGQLTRDPSWPSVLSRTLVGTLVLFGAYSGQSESAVAPPPACVQNPVEFIQITTSKLNAGEQTFEGLRVTRAGMLERARWTSRGDLIEHAGPSAVDTKIFDRIASALRLLDASPRDAVDRGLDGFASRVEIARLSSAGVTWTARNRIPRDVAELLDALRTSRTANTLQTGRYVWTRPVPIPRDVDIELMAGACESPIGKALSLAISTGRLIVPVDDEVHLFPTGSRAGRIEFTAELGVSGFRFGLVSVR